MAAEDTRRPSKTSAHDIETQARMDRIARRLDRLRIELGLDADKRKAS